MKNKVFTAMMLQVMVLGLTGAVIAGTPITAYAEETFSEKVNNVAETVDEQQPDLSDEERLDAVADIIEEELFPNADDKTIGDHS